MRQAITTFIIIAACILGAAAIIGAKSVPSIDFEKQHRIERGAYLVTIGGCNDCHTPLKMGPQGPEPDRSRLLSGHPEQLAMPPAPPLPKGPWMWTGAATNTAFAGPWGVSYARNLTPDQVTGIGIWNEEMFIKTLRTGKHWGVSRPILPPMPWQNLRQMKEEDLRDIYAYLQSLKPIHNQVPDAVLAPPPGKG
jgi:mono/diheme cytochrome c family protein